MAGNKYAELSEQYLLDIEAGLADFKEGAAYIELVNEYKRLAAEQGTTNPKGVSPPWLVGKDFNSNPQNRARAGRGKTSLVSLAKKWKSEGGDEEVTKKQLQEVYKAMFGASRREIEAVAKDRDAPLAVTVLAESLLDPKSRAKTLADTQQWLFGKAIEEINLTRTSVIEVSSEEEAAIKKLLDGKI